MAVGRSRAVTDGLGNSLRFLLLNGNRNDSCMARELLEPFVLQGKLILTDQAYDSDKFVRWINVRSGIVAIPAVSSTRTSEIPISIPIRRGIQ